MLKPYTRKGANELRANLNDPHAQQAWYGNDAFVDAVCFNEAVAKQLNLPKPQSWEDLTNPVYKGHIAMPNPASSGTGICKFPHGCKTWAKIKRGITCNALIKILPITHILAQNPGFKRGWERFRSAYQWQRVAQNSKPWRTLGCDCTKRHWLGIRSGRARQRKRCGKAWTIGLSRKRQMGCILRAIL